MTSNLARSVVMARAVKESMVKAMRGRVDVRTYIEAWRGNRLVACVQTARGEVHDADLRDVLSRSIGGYSPDEIIVVREMVGRVDHVDDPVPAPGEMAAELENDPASKSREMLLLVAIPRDGLAHGCTLFYDYAENVGAPPTIAWLGEHDLDDIEHEVAALVDLVRRCYAATDVPALLVTLGVDPRPDDRPKIDRAASAALADRGYMVALFGPDGAARETFGT